MDIYNEDILELWKALAKHDVQYIMIGGFAVNLHKHYRTTGDIDLYINDTPENRTKLGKALEEIGVSTREIIERMQFIPGWSVMNLLHGFPLDIMTKVKGLESLPFIEYYDLASIAEIEGISVRFLHMNHLLASKKAANRPKDQIDVIALEEIKREKEENGAL